MHCVEYIASNELNFHNNWIYARYGVHLYIRFDMHLVASLTSKASPVVEF